ncbi:MAG: hypothetical protein HY722_03910 [Planctomycetes bacterium]|nr:hypothetical protein [Planctomycetota bacterium]
MSRGRLEFASLQTAIEGFWRSRPEPEFPSRTPVEDPGIEALGTTNLNRTLDEAFRRLDRLTRLRHALSKAVGLVSRMGARRGAGPDA